MLAEVGEQVRVLAQLLIKPRAVVGIQLRGDFLGCLPRVADRFPGYSGLLG